MSPSLALTKRQYRFIGKELARLNPDQALAILNGHIPAGVNAEEKDPTRISLFLSRFCDIYGQNRESFVGSLRKPNKVEVRRIFIGAMVHLFNPMVFNQSPDNLLFSFRFTRTLAETLHLDEGNISKSIREVITRKKVYTDFACHIEYTVERLKEMEVCDGSTQG